MNFLPPESLDIVSQEVIDVLRGTSDMIRDAREFEYLNPTWNFETWLNNAMDLDVAVELIHATLVRLTVVLMPSLVRGGDDRLRQNLTTFVTELGQPPSTLSLAISRYMELLPKFAGDEKNLQLFEKVTKQSLVKGAAQSRTMLVHMQHLAARNIDYMLKCVDRPPLPRHHV